MRIVLSYWLYFLVISMCFRNLLITFKNEYFIREHIQTFIHTNIKLYNHRFIYSRIYMHIWAAYILNIDRNRNTDTCIFWHSLLVDTYVFYSYTHKSFRFYTYIRTKGQILIALYKTYIYLKFARVQECYMLPFLSFIISKYIWLYSGFKCGKFSQIFFIPYI